MNIGGFFATHRGFYFRANVCQLASDGRHESVNLAVGRFVGKMLDVLLSKQILLGVKSEGN